MAESPSRWLALNDRLAAIDPDDPGQLTDAIAATYETIAETPAQLLQDYKGFSEKALTEALATRAALVMKGEIAVTEASEERLTLLDAARLLRALEANALEGTFRTESDLGEDLERLWVTTDGRYYVVPRIAPLAALDGKPFLRRALRHYRVLPTEMPGFRVRLHRTPLAATSAMAAGDRAGKQRSFGAALFPGLKAVLSDPAIEGFTVIGLDGFDGDEMIDAHLAQARAENATAIVWGELTMPEARVTQVQQDLADRALDGDSALRYLVAGSWHRDIDAEMRNVAVILDGNGELLFEVLKWAKFDIAGRTESIVPGKEIHVLVCEDELITVAVCRDFLEGTTDVPYLRLNVDLAIVPSMISGIAEHATMDGHAVTAKLMRVRYGTRTMVVAQPAVSTEGDVGQVMALPDDPMTDKAVLVDGAWHACPLASS
ncbi:hypothetical protein AEB_P3152 [Altererythrobacter sp. B11]|uniref:hypothetical protein n=1 Tax=Altererythrobacter sp. B11 TaxID=2060312 RepID=UPI000DC73131|nr:hypothetical protein [Altererythrobacter sp. B11]BBC74020.1 hypothetical protein AEB_P3152 [Altererythrobacter sp. B11]